MLNGVSQVFQDYYDQIPADTFKTAGLSALFSFTAALFPAMSRAGANQSVSLSRPALAAGIAFTAAIIHGLITPIFNYLFSNPNNDFNGFEGLIKIAINMTLTEVLINHTTAFKINLLTANRLRDGNFILMTSNIIKLSAHVVLQVYSFSPPLQQITKKICDILGLDFNVNSNPVYVVV